MKQCENKYIREAFYIFFLKVKTFFKFFKSIPVELVISGCVSKYHMMK